MTKQPEGEPWKVYLCDYQYEGYTWSVEIPATSFDDARKRLQAMQQGEIVGELKLSVFIPISQGWLELAKNRIIGLLSREMRSHD